MEASAEGRLWNRVTRYLSSSDLVRLYATGNRYLCHTLEKRGGVTRITHVVRVEGDVKSIDPILISKSTLFPRFLLVRFRNFLRYLSIQGIKDHEFVEADPPLGLSDFQLLPAGLKELIIPFHFKVTNEIINVLPTSLEILRLGREYSMPNWVVSSLPQGLKVLDIGSHQDFGDSIAPQLPLSLTSISFPSNIELSGEFLKNISHLQLVQLNLARNKNISGQDFTFLPRTLKHLNLASLPHITMDNVSRLPSRLLSLELTCLAEMTDEGFKSLPRSLTSLNLESASGYSAQAIKYFPQRLTRLTIGITTQLDGDQQASSSSSSSVQSSHHPSTQSSSSSSSSTIHQLPPHLASTSHQTPTSPLQQSSPSPQPLHNGYSSDSIIGINALPKTLTFLAMDKCISLGILKKKINLPHLTHLSIPKIDQFDEHNIHFLPQSLIKLNLLYATKLTPKALSLLPPNLSFLSVCSSSSSSSSSASQAYSSSPSQPLGPLPQHHPSSSSSSPSSSLSSSSTSSLPSSTPCSSLTSSSTSSLGLSAWKCLSPQLFSRLPMPLPFDLLRGAAAVIIEKEIESSFSAANRPRSTGRLKNDSGTSAVDPSFGNVSASADDVSASVGNVSASVGNVSASAGNVSTAQTPLGRHHASRFTPLPRIRFDPWIQETMTRETLEILPDSLEYLDVTLATNLKSPYASLLPRGLRELYLPITSPVYSKEFEFLPRGLEVLFIGDAQHTCLKAGSPVTLDSLLLHAATHFNASVLPRRTSCSIHSMHYIHLPRTLKHLIIQTWTQNEVVLVDSASSSHHHQYHQQEQEKHHHHHHQQHYAPPSYAAAHHPLMDLPPSLLTLVLTPETSLSHGFFKYLPRTLTHLDLSTSPRIIDPDVAELPNTLTFLNVARASHLTDHCIPLLPSTLKTFICSKSRHFTGLGLKRLPRGLTHLNFDQSFKVTDAAIASLPSTLTCLSLRWAIELTDACAPLLPRNLTTFKVTHNSTLTPACLPSLPSSLTRFEAAFTRSYDLISPHFPPVHRKFNPTVLSRLKPEKMKH